MPSPFTLRLDTKTRRRIERIARRKDLSTSDVVRQAIAAWADNEETSALPYDLMADLIGVVRGGNPERSAQTGRRLAALLKNRSGRN